MSVPDSGGTSPVSTAATGAQGAGVAAMNPYLIGGGMLLGAASNIIGGNSAASAEEQAAQAQIAYEQQVFQWAQGAEQPYMQAGTQALGNLTSNLGNYTNNFNTQTMQQTDPGYQFQMQQGQQALQRSAASQGLTGSGGTLKALTQYGQNYANTAYNNAFDQFMTNRQANFGNLSSLVQGGQNAIGTVAGVGQNYANQAGAAAMGAGNAQAANYMNTANSINSGISGGINTYQNSNLLSALYNRNQPQTTQNTPSA